MLNEKRLIRAAGMRQLPGGSLGVLLLALLSAGCSQGTVPVSYKETIAPMLTEHCGRCHENDGIGTQQTGLAMDSYEQLMQGTRLGPVIHPGNPAGSTLMALVEARTDPAIRMPIDGHNPLAEDDLKLLRRWIEEGAKDN